MDILCTESAKRTGLMKKGMHYLAIGNETYSKAGDSLLTSSHKAVSEWRGTGGELGRTPGNNRRANILDASAAIALTTEPQQTVWLRHLLLLKCVEPSQRSEAMGTLLKSHDWLGEPLTKETHPHLFPVKTRR